MHATFVRSSVKFNMLHSAKLPLVRLYSTRQGTKTKNHYDTLKITPHATQNEVKSAYYKLTLQYHPDKNKSDYAKQKFQDISEAYEVLSNHEQRRIYDRGMLLRRQPAATTEEPMSYYKDKVYSGTSKIYDFDAWTKAHYGRQMHADRIRRRAYENYKMTEEMNARSKENPRFMEPLMLLITLMMVAIIFREKPDVPASARRKKESKDN
ncbi:dnaJ homolog subfamily C member 30, mitochondrial [Solenopsis invicta]|uniref:dnaJ homolog subfamily C member 30, mitochondrial n=1 Tax=Solenopsis invicta TaxID=13686 RepID=UPI0005960C87|nr:dnaJ homolog subfamily C member 30, mitochondrial [Solenopsis invicta]